MSEELKSLTVEQYQCEHGEYHYNVCGMKNTEDCCGVSLKGVLDSIKKQMAETKKSLVREK